MPSLFLDIESQPSELYAGWKEKYPDVTRMPPIYCHEVHTLSWCILEDDVVTDWDSIHRGDMPKERELLEVFNHVMDPEHRDKPKYDIVTWYGSKFDLLLLSQAMFRNGLPMGWYFQHAPSRMKFKPEGHLDLHSYLVDYSYEKWSLDAASKMIGMPGKVDIDGPSVWELVGQGDHQRVANYCIQDVLELMFVYFRSRLLIGDWSLKYYRSVVFAAHEKLSSHNSGELVPAINALFDKTDMKQLLLT